MTDNNQRQWSAWYSLKIGSRVYLKVKEKHFSILTKIIPHDVGFQPYTGDDAEAGEG